MPSSRSEEGTVRCWTEKYTKSLPETGGAHEPPLSQCQLRSPKDSQGMPSVLIPMPAGLGAVSFLYRGLGTAPTPLKNNTGFKHQEYHAKSARNQLNPVREIFCFSFLQYQPKTIRGREREGETEGESHSVTQEV